MDIAKRIAQFENMASADPTNEMAHFSLGRAYADAGRHADAARAYRRCTELVPDMSKAYQLAGESFVNAGLKDDATQLLLRGCEIASTKGDRMPLESMVKALRSLGVSIPDAYVKAITGGGATLGIEGKPHTGPVPEGMIVDRVTGRLGTKMTRPPMRGPVGEWIAAHVSHETFYKGWVPQGTKVINELRLDLSREKDSETYDQHMREYLGIDAQVLKTLGL